MARIVLHLTIRGKVQGVGYRYWMARAANDFGIEGWVRNRRDGSVEAVVGGERSVVESMIQACKRGPPSAHVTSLNVADASEDELNLRRPGEAFSELPTL